MRQLLRRAPWPARFLYLVLADATRRFQSHRCTTAAAAIAFHVFFSFFPLVLLVSAIVGTRMSNAEFRARVTSNLMASLPLDPSAAADIDQLLLAATNNLPALGIVGAIGLIWSASGMLGSVRGAMELAWEGHSGTRAFLHGKLVDAVLLTILVCIVLSSFLAGIVLSVMPQISVDVLPPGGGLANIAQLVRSSLGPVVAITTSVAVLTLGYKLLPSPRPAWRYALLGAIVGAVLLDLARLLLTIYLDQVARYDIIYGSIGSIIAFLFFIYIAANVTLIGAEIGASIRRVYAAQRVLRPPANQPMA